MPPLGPFQKMALVHLQRPLQTLGILHGLTMALFGPLALRMGFISSLNPVGWLQCPAISFV